MRDEKTKLTVPAAILSLVCPVAGFSFEKPAVDPFEPLASIQKEELLPKGAGFAVARDGSLVVDGKPRYLPGVIWYDPPGWGTNRNEDDFGPLQWLYNRMPDY